MERTKVRILLCVLALGILWAWPLNAQVNDVCDNRPSMWSPAVWEKICQMIPKPPEPEVAPEYKVGVNYHATTENFVTKPGVFVRYYHETETRMKVIEQLQEMANAGATIIKTSIWLVDDPENRTPDTGGDGAEGAWRLAFPLSGQDLANVIQYTNDVAQIRGRDGNLLELRFTLGWLGCADYQRHLENPDGTYTWCHYTWDEVIERAKESVFNLIYGVGQITRPDGERVLSAIYLEGEVMISAKPNQERFLLDVYPYFVEHARLVGVEPTVYFLIAASEGEIMHHSFTDSEYPEINGHRPLYWMFRSTEFMRRNGLPVPKKLDFSFYPTPSPGSKTSYGELVREVFGDIRAVYGNVPTGVAETYYFPDYGERWKLGQAFADEFLRSENPREVVFWTTPDGGGRGTHIGPPFDFESYKPHPPQTPKIPPNLF